MKRMKDLVLINKGNKTTNDTDVALDNPFNLKKGGLYIVVVTDPQESIHTSIVFTRDEYVTSSLMANDNDGKFYVIVSIDTKNVEIIDVDNPSAYSIEIYEVI